MTVALSKSDSLKEISKWLEFSALLLLGAQYIRTRRQLWTMIVIICLAAISQAFYGYIQYLFNLGPQVFVRDTSLRVYGTFGQPNPFAGYINMPLSIVLDPHEAWNYCVIGFCGSINSGLDSSTYLQPNPAYPGACANFFYAAFRSGLFDG